MLQVEVPEQLKSDLAEQMKSAGIPVPDSAQRWTMALDALKACTDARLRLHLPVLSYRQLLVMYTVA